MQYKIPVQIENEDVIIFNLSLKQLIILLIFGAIAYSVFKAIEPVLWWAVAAIPAIFIVLIWLIIVLFKHSEMTFIPFILNLIRVNVDWEDKIWVKWVDSIDPLDIWYVTQIENKKENLIELSSKKDKIKKITEKLNKI